MQNQEPSARYSGMLDCTRAIVRERGLSGLTTGFTARYARMGSWQMVFWLVYERSLLLLQGRSL